MTNSQSPNRLSLYNPQINTNEDEEPKNKNKNNKENILDVQELINLTELGLHNNDLNATCISINSSECVCCSCPCDSSIILVTNDGSCRLDHSLFSGLRTAQMNSTLEYLAVSNESKILIVDVVNRNCQSIYTNYIKIIDLCAHNLSLENDIVHWSWIDSYTLAVVSNVAFYTCRIDMFIDDQKPKIRHPAHSAILDHHKFRTQLLPLTREFQCHTRLTSQFLLSRSFSSAQLSNGQSQSQTNLESAPYNAQHYHRDLICNIKRDSSQNIFAIAIQSDVKSNDSNFISVNNLDFDTRSLSSSLGGSSSTNRLSRSLTNNVLNSYVTSELSSLDYSSFSVTPTNQATSPTSTSNLIQVHCKRRNRSQVIESHALTFATRSQSFANLDQQQDCGESTLLIAANKITNNNGVNSIKIYYIEMSPVIISNGLSLSQHIALPAGSPIDDVPMAIHSISFEDSSNRQLAFILTRYGLLNICDVYSASLLTQLSIIPPPNPSSPLEMKLSRPLVSILTSTLMIVSSSKNPAIMMIDSYSGRVFLTTIKTDKLSMPTSSQQFYSATTLAYGCGKEVTTATVNSSSHQRQKQKQTVQKEESIYLSDSFNFSSNSSSFQNSRKDLTPKNLSRRNSATTQTKNGKMLRRNSGKFSGSRRNSSDLLNSLAAFRYSTDSISGRIRKNSVGSISVNRSRKNSSDFENRRMSNSDLSQCDIQDVIAEVVASLAESTRL